MTVDIGLKFYLAVKVTGLESYINSKCLKLKFNYLYYPDPLIDFIDIWHDVIYRSNIFLSAIPKLGYGLFDTNIKVFSYIDSD